MKCGLQGGHWSFCRRSDDRYGKFIKVFAVELQAFQPATSEKFTSQREAEYTTKLYQQKIWLTLIQTAPGLTFPSGTEKPC
jgi:hypothetical protein